MIGIPLARRIRSKLEVEEVTKILVADEVESLDELDSGAAVVPPDDESLVFDESSSLFLLAVSGSLHHLASYDFKLPLTSASYTSLVRNFLPSKSQAVHTLTACTNTCQSSGQSEHDLPGTAPFISLLSSQPGFGFLPPPEPKPESDPEPDPESSKNPFPE